LDIHRDESASIGLQRLARYFSIIAGGLGDAFEGI
jgi:hypothetical protein